MALRHARVTSPTPRKVALQTPLVSGGAIQLADKLQRNGQAPAERSALGQCTRSIAWVLLMCSSCAVWHRLGYRHRAGTGVCPWAAHAAFASARCFGPGAASYQLRLTRTRTRARHRVARLGRAPCPTAHPVSYGTFHASMACSGVAFPPLVMSALVRHGPGPWCSTAPLSVLMARPCDLTAHSDAVRPSWSCPSPW